MDESDGLEIERKLLARIVSDPAAEPGARALALRQHYLLDDGAGGSRRVRESVEGGVATYTLTAKTPVSAGVRREVERELERAEFDALLAEADPARRPVVKTRHVVPSGGRTWEIDVFEGALAGLVLAEVELERVEELDDALVPPPCIAVVRDVTDDPRYGNAGLARLDAPPAP